MFSFTSYNFLIHYLYNSEYGLGTEVSTRGDIYSFGILLLEILTAKRPTHNMFEKDFNLHNYATAALSDCVMDIIDPELAIEDVAAIKECLISMVKLGVACSVESPQDRINISQVINELKRIKNILFQPIPTFETKQGSITTCHIFHCLENKS